MCAKLSSIFAEIWDFTPFSVLDGWGRLSACNTGEQTEVVLAGNGTVVLRTVDCRIVHQLHKVTTQRDQSEGEAPRRGRTSPPIFVAHSKVDV